MPTRNIFQVIDFIQYIVKKERGVFITPAEATTNLDAGQLDCFEEWFKVYGETQEIHDALRPFRVYYQFTSDSSGMVTFPADYLHIIGTAFTVAGSTVNEITVVNEDEFISALVSQLRPVSNSSPIARDTNVGLSVYPQVTQTGFFSYLRRPVTPVYGYAQVGRVITYDPNTSTQLEWSDVYLNNIIARSLKFAGINMDEQAISQFAEQYDQETK